MRNQSIRTASATKARRSCTIVWTNSTPSSSPPCNWRKCILKRFFFMINGTNPNTIYRGESVGCYYPFYRVCLNSRLRSRRASIPEWRRTSRLRTRLEQFPEVKFSDLEKNSFLFRDENSTRRDNEPDLIDRQADRNDCETGALASP